jgi:AraC-like DNA-binding protein
MRKWQRINTSELRRHVHRCAYAALVLSGSYEEAGDLGRFHVQAGDVIIHDPFEGHLNHFPASGAVILNLVLAPDRVFQPGIGKVADPDSIVRIAENSDDEAATLLIASMQQRGRGCTDWPDQLANALIQDPSLGLSSWSEETGIAPWTLSRGFTQVFGISPRAFRARTRTRIAWKAIQRSKEPLAGIAASLGFADQSHMTRSVKKMTGKAPQAWRYCCK